MIIHDDNVTYEQWCKNLGRDPRDDENYNAYCEWKNSQQSRGGLEIFLMKSIVKNTIFFGGGYPPEDFGIPGAARGASC